MSSQSLVEIRIIKKFPNDRKVNFVAINVLEKTNKLAKLRAELQKNRYMDSFDAFESLSGFPIHKDDELHIDLKDFNTDPKGDAPDLLPNAALKNVTITIIPRAFDIRPYTLSSSTPGAKGQRLGSAELEKDVAPVMNARTLSKAQLDELYDINNILGGTSITGPSGSAEQIIEPPEDLMRYIWSHDGSEYEVTQTKREKQTSLVKEGVYSGSVGVERLAKVAIAIDHSDKESWEESKTYTYMVATYRFPRAIIKIPQHEMRPTQKFRNELSAALAYSPDSNLRKLRMIDFFNSFGHTFASEIHLGGHLHTTLTAITSNAEDMKEKATQIQVGISSPFGVKGDFGYENKTSSARSEKEENSNLVVEAVGGDTLLASVPMTWATTVMPFTNWRITKRAKLNFWFDIPGLVSGVQRTEIMKILGLDPSKW